MRIAIVGLLGCLASVGCDSGSSAVGGAGGTVPFGSNVGGATTGTSGVGGALSTGGAGVIPGGGNSSTIGASGVGGGTGTPEGGAGSIGGATSGATTVVGPGSYALPPPDPCSNKYYIDGCTPGDKSSKCGGFCQPPSAGHNEGKTGEVGYICPRFMLFADVMRQAALDDAKANGWLDANGNSPFEYAVVGHDNDGGKLDNSDGASVCCQCYQLIPYLPDEAQVIKNGASSVPLPKPLIVQAFNTGATTTSFDVYMGAGGIGAVNGCMAPVTGFEPFYSAYPSIGQTNDGGVKAAGNPGNGTACKDSTNMVTEATISSAGCVKWIEDGCNQIVQDNPATTAQSRRSCIDSNKATSFYHLNWKVYAKRVACPKALTEVTGCKLVENKPAIAPKVLTPESAKADSSFLTGYHTTSMEDCSKPTCAARDKVSGEKQVTDPEYTSFYTCDKQGVPFTTEHPANSK